MADVRTYRGRLIARERLRREWSQAGLAQGICSVSYLSKIEAGKADASEEIVRALLAKLGLQVDDALEHEAAARAEAAYEALFSGDPEGLRDLMGDADAKAYRATAAGPDLLMLEALALHEPLEKDLAPEDCRSGRQRALLAVLQDDQLAAIGHLPCAYTYLEAGIHDYVKGSYAAAVEHLQAAYDLAARDGSARIMLYAKLYLGNCCCNQLDTAGMEKHYRVAGRLARALGDTGALDSIAYNTASGQIETGDYEAAYRHFSQLENPGKLALHKLAICCEKTGRTGEALAALGRAATLAEDGLNAPLADRLCDLVRYRLEHADYLKHAAYGDLLLSCYETCVAELPMGYAAFHLPWVIEWYRANRQYRKAYELLANFPFRYPLNEF